MNSNERPTTITAAEFVADDYAGKIARGERDFRDELMQLINSHSKENGSNTPDLILASYLLDCLTAFDRAVQDREAWYGRPPAKPMADVSVEIRATEK